MAGKAAVIGGIALIIVGLMMGFAAYESPSLAVITVNGTSSTSSLSVLADYPTSTVSTSPTLLPYNTGGTFVYVNFITPEYGSGSTVSASSGSVVINGVTESAQVTHYEQTTSIKPVELQDWVLQVGFTYSPSLFKTSIPMVFTGSITVSGTVSGASSTSSIAYSGSLTTYGEFTQNITNIGQWYVAASDFNGHNYAPQPITNTSSITFNFTKFPGQLNFSYVETVGTTLNMAYAYVTINGVEYNISMTNNESIINGFTAYSVYIKIGSAGTFTVHGYLMGNVNTNHAPIQLMSIGLTIPAYTPPPTHFTENQIATFIVAAIFVIAGAIVLGRHFV